MLFEEAAARSDPDAHYNLATMHLSGGAGGEGRNEQTAFKAFEAASDAGHWRAPYTLATMHAQVCE
jgi:TPR repeat protein